MDEKDDEVKVESFELPPFPDHSGAPLDAWKHYDITNFASNKIVEELEKFQYAGYTVGLEVGYSVEEEEKHVMSFGKVDLTEHEMDDESEQPDLPISDEFLLSLSQTVSDYMKTNVPDGDKINPELTFVISGSLLSFRTMCRAPQVCNRGHTGRRWCKRVNAGRWTCLHSSRCT